MKFKLDNFEGPLDLLLNLIKKNKMDIYNINISLITKEYIDFINKEDSIDQNSEYLVMASELIYLKSKLIVKEDTDDDVEEEISEEKLIQKLIEYEKIKSVTKNFEDLRKERKQFYSKEPVEVNDVDILDNSNLSVEDLEKAFTLFLNRQELNKPLEKKITKRELSVSEKIKSIRNILKNKQKLVFWELFENSAKDQMIVTFLSILEMTNQKEITVYQDNYNSDIYIESRI